MGSYLVLLLLITIHMMNGEPCDDIDTEACKQLEQNDPEFCTKDDASKFVCKKYCGLCPTVPPTLPPCTDIDSTACKQMETVNYNLCNDDIARSVCRKYCGFCNISCYSCADVVQDLSLCTSTISCNPRIENCFTDLIVNNTKHSFRKGCRLKAACQQSASNLIGKRFTGTLTTCCDTDLCNKG